MDIKKLSKIYDSAGRVKDEGKKFSKKELVENPPRWVKDQDFWEKVVDKVTHNGEKEVDIVVALKKYKTGKGGTSAVKDSKDEFKELRKKFDEWEENGDADAYEITEKENGDVLVEEAFSSVDHTDEISDFFKKLGYKAHDDWSKHDSYFTLFRKEEVEDSQYSKLMEILKKGKKVYEKGREDYIFIPQSKEDLKDVDDIVYPEDEEWKKIVKMYGDGKTEKEADFFAFGFADGSFGRFGKDAFTVNDKTATIADKEYLDSENYYEQLDMEIKDDSGEEQYDRGVKAGREAKEKGWDKEQTEKYYHELHQQFMEGVAKGLSEITDSAEYLEDKEFIEKAIETGCPKDMVKTYYDWDIKGKSKEELEELYKKIEGQESTGSQGSWGKRTGWLGLMRLFLEKELK